MTARITGSGSALPAPMDQQRLWDGFFREHYNDARLARKVWQHSGITTRRGVVDPTVEDISTWGTGARMQRFLAEAMPLGKEAVSEALADAGVDPADVGLLTVVSCTGYVTPGLDILLARDLGMTPAVQRLHIGHMGCYAAIPGLASTADAVAARGRTAVMLCLELTSLHVQPPTEDAEQVVVEGQMAGDVFEAKHILVKCPSKYNDGREFERAEPGVRPGVPTAQASLR